MDGLCDAADAIASRQGPEKRLEILRDPRTGAFGVMAVCGVLLLTCALWDTLLPGLDARSFGVVCLGFILSRALSGMAVATFPLAKESGLVHTFATGADKRGVELRPGHRRGHPRHQRPGGGSGAAVRRPRRDGPVRPRLLRPVGGLPGPSPL